ncbi:SGT1-domain-containing protein [Macrolepiota fuliginosa MF-IS2]|uniref:SGT1-domain-containing protein n=1 Tax=Macrolepiota fuliginosa MF-IS2 TaxID=1400762 RepID=A0A9P5XKG3_9AGAR|nr:SGT1-domain-containing protein [Macrolepiota fuliginosa MF-IS2]
MDIFNRPPSIAEDTLQYTLYPPPHLSDKTSVLSLAACAREYADGLLPNFIWHRDAFELKAAEDTENKTWYLEGRVRVGDCVDDEWCIVWLLREISSKWDLAISIYDSDGEFLLIEAAEVLPSWVKPSNAENRVWIYNSRLHLIPLSHISPPSRKRRHRKYTGNAGSGEEDNLNEEGDDYLAVEDALELVRDNVRHTLAPAKVEGTIWNRISGYPAAQREHMHTAKAYVPVDVAKALLANQSLVQKAVETFYTRDAIQLRSAHRMSRFPPNTSVLRSIRMTRTAYAQLVGQKFFPPKIFGQWKESEGSKEYHWKDTGMKIAVGFEMLYQETRGRSAANELAVEKSKAEANKDALRRNIEYSQYIQNLVSAGYFKGEKEESQLWNELETKAANTFVEIRSPSTAQRQSFAHQVDLAIAGAVSIGDPGLQEEDDDSWLNIDMEEFEEKLEKTMGQAAKVAQEDAMEVDPPGSSEEDRMASEQAARLKDLASKVEKFVEGEGDIEGARFEDEEFSDEALSDDSENVDSIQQETRGQPFGYATRSAATKEAMDKLVPGLDPSDYGKMPASYYRNSQRVAPTTITTDVVEHGVSETEKPPETRARPIREPILPRDTYEGVDSDDETDEEDEDEDSEEDRPQVVGEVEIDMGEEEEEFLEFSRQALGISDEQWSGILQDRRGRGAFVPKSATNAKKSEMPLPQPATKPEGMNKGLREPQPGPRPNINPELDSFEAVMSAMDAELSRLRAPAGNGKNKAPSSEAAKSDNGKGKEKAHVIVEDEDIEAAMEAELKATLERGHDDESGEENEPMDYNLIKNFLESFKSQAGLSGPVSSLAGRLEPGFQLPRDDS